MIPQNFNTLPTGNDTNPQMNFFNLTDDTTQYNNQQQIVNPTLYGSNWPQGHQGNQFYQGFVDPMFQADWTPVGQAPPAPENPQVEPVAEPALNQPVADQWSSQAAQQQQRPENQGANPMNQLPATPQVQPDNNQATPPPANPGYYPVDLQATPPAMPAMNPATPQGADQFQSIPNNAQTPTNPGYYPVDLHAAPPAMPAMQTTPPPPANHATQAAQTTPPTNQGYYGIHPVVPPADPTNAMYHPWTNLYPYQAYPQPDPFANQPIYHLPWNYPSTSQATNQGYQNHQAAQFGTQHPAVPNQRPRTPSQMAQHQQYFGVYAQQPQYDRDQIKACLNDPDQNWRKSHALGNEMKVSLRGKELNPQLKYKITGLHPELRYKMSVYLVRTSDKIMTYSDKLKWHEKDTVTDAPEKSNEVAQQFLKTGKSWMQKGIDFSKLKIYNNPTKSGGNGVGVRDSENMLLVTSMCKYKPVLNVYESSATGEKLVATCSFNHTQFIAVTGIKNPKLANQRTANNKFTTAEAKKRALQNVEKDDDKSTRRQSSSSDDSGYVTTPNRSL